MGLVGIKEGSARDAKPSVCTPNPVGLGMNRIRER